ncbi:hypothetical protein SteCoe_13722 [Stentor coeruleus]|uniref:Aldehyde dehydrogenase n=1 Tax=Stentor coeruleus TaxID=5963 RepID=A0A1R2C7T5_9CILI|nr:hypothetical protein SteCoe_13722 [Stentor coeruleus]
MEGSPKVLVKSIQRRLREGLNQEKNRSYNSRVNNLLAFKRVVAHFAPKMKEAILSDLGRSHFLTDFTEIGGIDDVIDYLLKNLKTFMADQPRDISAMMAPSKAYVKPEPYGVTLILGSWNFPYATTLHPLVSAIAAGNVVCIKPSEMCPKSSAVMKEIIDALDQSVFACIEGGPEVAISVLEERWDLIVFTGSPEKGKLVAAAAAKHLTPTVLELGGKNPVVIDKDVDIDNAAKRIVQGRYINAGQLCIAPDMAFVHASRIDEFLDKVRVTITEFYGPNPKLSKDYSRIVNEMHTRRIASMLENHGGTVICGGEVDVKEKYIAPTVILNPRKDVPLGCQEVFGPVLVVFPFNNIEECIEIINSREKPLALYYFGNNKQNMELLKNKTSSGNITWNDCIMHYTICDLPFGGVGNSGLSKMFGEEGFRAMSHAKSVLERGTNNRYPASVRFPPYTEEKQRTFNRLKGWMNFSLRSAKCNMKKAAVIAVIGFLAYQGYLNPVLSKLVEMKNVLTTIASGKANNYMLLSINHIHKTF